MNKFIKRFLWILLVLGGPVSAVEVVYTWDEATAKVDGSPLLPEEIDTYVIRVYEAGTVIHQVESRTSGAIIDQAPGFYAATIATKDIGGNEGPESAPLSVPVVVGIPGPPINFAAGQP